MEFTKDAGVIGLALLGSTSAFSIWSAANPSVFTISQFTTEQSKKNARLGMNIGLGLCGALSAGIYLAYGKKGTLPALLTGATGVGLYALYEWMLSTHHISNPNQETMAQQATGFSDPGAQKISQGDWAPGTMDEQGNLWTAEGDLILRAGRQGAPGAHGGGGGGGGSIGGGGGDPNDPSTWGEHQQPGVLERIPANTGGGFKPPGSSFKPGGYYNSLILAGGGSPGGETIISAGPKPRYVPAGSGPPGNRPAPGGSGEDMGGGGGGAGEAGRTISDDEMKARVEAMVQDVGGGAPQTVVGAGGGGFRPGSFMYPPPEPYCPPDGGPCIQLLEGWGGAGGAGGGPGQPGEPGEGGAPGGRAGGGIGDWDEMDQWIRSKIDTAGKTDNSGSRIKGPGRTSGGSGNFPGFYQGEMTSHGGCYIDGKRVPCSGNIGFGDERIGWANYDPRHPDFRPISGETSTY